MSDPLLEARLSDQVPAQDGLWIGFVGTGGIVNFAHIPAYLKAGFNLVGCYDINRESVERTARSMEFHVYTNRSRRCCRTQRLR